MRWRRENNGGAARPRRASRCGNRCLSVLLAALALLPARPVVAADGLLVFAASSLAGPLDEVAALYTERSAVPVRISYAASSTLARQIVAGAPADVYVAANAAWMDYVRDAGGIVDGTRFDWVGNTLVLVAPQAEAVSLAARPLADLLAGGRVAIGDPDHVPAGMYAREALSNLGLWDDLHRRAVRADNVRAALALVARGEVAVGIVYATDAALEPGVGVVARLPDDSYTPVVYPAAALAGGDRSAGRAFVDFLRGEPATAAMERAGFTSPLR